VEGRFGASAVWTGREVLFWGGQAGPDRILADGAGYDPATRRWRMLPAAPIGGRTGHQAVWTGREMIVWGGYARCCPTDSVVHDPAAAAYDPASDRWRRIADVPAPWSGDDGTAVTVAGGGRVMVWRRRHLGVYDPTADRWSEVAGTQPAPAPTPAGSAGGAALLSAATGDPLALGAPAGDEVFLWNGNVGRPLEGLAYRPSTATWRRTAPLEAQTGARIVAGDADRLFVAAGQSARILEYRISQDRWEELPLPPVPTRSAAVLAWTGSELLFWGGIGDEGPEMDGAVWRG
jgi:N-acetylneuraminic acid mutarotase